MATADAFRPKQANLRRALSSAYYALFHALIDDACRLAIGGHVARQGFRNALSRAFDHGSMKDACASFGGGTLKANVSRHLPPGFAVPTPIRDCAEHFVELQELRHKADYDLSERFSRAEVAATVRETREVLRAFRALASAPERDFFLASLHSWKEMAKR